MKPLLIVVGATGNQGKSVVDALIQSNQWTVRGLSRNLSSKTSQVTDRKQNDSELIAFSGVNGARGGNDLL